MMRLITFLGKNSNKKEEIFRLIIRPDFIEDIDRLRQRFDIYPNDFESFNPETEQLFISNMENAELNKAVKQLINKYKASPRWHGVIVQYVVNNDFIPSNDTDPDGLRLEKEILEEGATAHPEYALIINNETTLNDIKIAWPKIQKELDRDKKKKRKPWVKFWRDYEIYKLAQAGATIAEIHRKINGVGEDLDFGNIKKIESEFRKRIGINKKYRKKKLRTSLDKLSLLG